MDLVECNFSPTIIFLRANSYSVLTDTQVQGSVVKNVRYMW